MGALSSRQNADVEETDITANHAYRYPPKSGNYFGTHFIMGGERFDTPQPEAYLFGENADLNFLGSRPTVFPYPPPQSIEPTRTLKSLVNIRKESVRFVKSTTVDTVDTVALHKAQAQQQAAAIVGDGGKATAAATAPTNALITVPSLPQQSPVSAAAYNIEFVYDADVKCAITIYYFCTEEVTSHGCSYVSREPMLTSETFHCSSGINQVFSQTSHIFRPHLFADDDLYYHSDRDVLPVVIHCVVDEGTDDPKQSHTTICVVDHHTDGTYVLRALKQKIFVDGLCYLLQEIYGIENKNMHKAAVSAMDEDTDDNGSECVICMCDTRDTLILPCRHLCLCNSCADSLRYQANNCPICRAPFRALLQIKAVRRKGALGGLSGTCAGSATVAAAPQSLMQTTGVISLQQQQQQQHQLQQQQQLENIPAGYVAVSLIEALNGPTQSRLCDTKIEELTVALDATDAIADKDTCGGGGDSAAALRTKSKDTVADGVTKAPKSSSSGGGGVHRSSKSAAAAKQQHQQLQLQQQQLRDTLKIVNEKLANTALSHDALANDPDDDSDAEKLSPLLDKRTQLSQSSRIAEKIAAQSATAAANAVPLELEAIKVALAAATDSSTADDETATTTQQPADVATATTVATVAVAAGPADDDNNTNNNYNISSRSSSRRTSGGADIATLTGAITDDSDYYTPEDPQTSILSPLCPPPAAAVASLAQNVRRNKRIYRTDDEA